MSSSFPESSCRGIGSDSRHHSGELMWLIPSLRDRNGMQINFQKGVTGVGMNPSPDETDVMDFHMGLRELKDLADADGVRSPREEAVITRFETAISRLTFRVNARGALESLIRNGKNRYTSGKAEDAGLTVIVSTSGQVLNIVPSESEGHTGFDPVAA